MPAIQNVVINDGQATPVAHTFAPAKIVADYALLEDRSSGVFVGFNKLSFQMQRPTGKATGGRNIKLEAKVETPKLETLGSAASGYTPPPTVAHRPVWTTGFTFPERCSLQDRKDLLAYAKGVMNSAEMAKAVEDYELPY